MLKLCVVVVACLVAVAVVGGQAFLLTLFSATYEFRNAGFLSVIALITSAAAVLLRQRRARLSVFAVSITFSIAAVAALLLHVGAPSSGTYVALPDISIPNWHFELFYWFIMALPFVLVLGAWLSTRAEPVARANELHCQ